MTWGLEILHPNRRSKEEKVEIKRDLSIQWQNDDKKEFIPPTQQQNVGGSGGGGDDSGGGGG